MKTWQILLGSTVLVVGGYFAYEAYANRDPASPALDRLKASNAASLVDAWHSLGSDDRKMFDLYVVQMDAALTGADLASIDAKLHYDLVQGMQSVHASERDVVAGALSSSFSAKRAKLIPIPQLPSS